MKLDDEVTTLPCEVCGEPKTVNVVYLPNRRCITAM